MAVELDGTIQSSAVTDSTQTYSWSHTIAANSNRLLVVVCSARDGTNGNISSISATWNTTENLTLNAGTSGSNSSRASHLLYLINPTATTANVEVTWSGAADTSRCHSYSLYNVHQTLPIADANSDVEEFPASAGTAITVGSMTSVPSGSYMIGIVGTNAGGGTFSAGGSETIDLQFSALGTGSPISQAVFRQAGVSGTVQPAITWTSSQNFSDVAASFQPVASAGSVRRRQVIS